MGTGRQDRIPSLQDVASRTVMVWYDRVWSSKPVGLDYPIFSLRLWYWEGKGGGGGGGGGERDERERERDPKLHVRTTTLTVQLSRI